MKIVIVGASGFVGRALALHLNQSQYEVVSVSRHEKPGFVQVNSYRECPKGDLLIHLAEESDIHKANLLGESYVSESSELTLTLCEKFNGKVIYCSSAVVYGDKNEEPNTEQGLVVDSNLYSKLKLRNERVVLEHDGCVLRLANLYAFGMSPNNVLSDILKQVGQDGVVSLRSTSPVRDFLYIQDLVYAISTMIDSFRTGIFNVGSGLGVSIQELVETVLSIAGESKREVVSLNPTQQNSVNYLDTSKISNAIGWYPKRSLRENLQTMLQDKV